MRTTAVIFDIDGTVADCKKRLIHIGKDDLSVKPDWDMFFSPDLVVLDAPITPIIEAVAAFDTLHKVIFCTARPERIRVATATWIGAHMPWLTSYSLYMRNDDDRRLSRDVKRDHLALIRKSRITPILAFEDRAADVSMWRSEGLVCCQVDEGAY